MADLFVRALENSLPAIRDLVMDYAPAVVAILSAAIASALAWRECGKRKQ